MGPNPGDRSFHEDCWNLARSRAVEVREEEQQDYRRRVASGGLAALLSPYVSSMPEQRVGLPDGADAPVADTSAAPVVPEPSKPLSV